MISILPTACAVCDRPMVGHRFQPTPGTFLLHTYRAPSGELRRQRAQARLAAGVRLVRDTTTGPEETKPVSSPDGPCGFCDLPREGHGTRYSTFGGYHEWQRTSRGWFPPRASTPEGDPR